MSLRVIPESGLCATTDGKILQRYRLSFPKKKKDSMTDDCLDYKFIFLGFVHMILQGNSIFFSRDLDRFRPRCEKYIPLSPFTIATLTKHTLPVAQ